MDTAGHSTKSSSHYTTVSTTSSSSNTAIETGKGGTTPVQNRQDASLAKGLLGECPKEFEPQQLMQQVQSHKQQRQWHEQKQPHIQQAHHQTNQQPQSHQRPQSSGTPQTFKAAVVGGSNNTRSALSTSHGKSTNGPLNSSLVVKPTSSTTLKEKAQKVCTVKSFQ